MYPRPHTADDALREASVRAYPLLGDIRRAAKGATHLGDTAVCVATARPDLRECVCRGERLDAESAFVEEQVSTLRVLAAHGGLSISVARKALLGALEGASDPAVVQCLLDAGVDATATDAYYGRHGSTWLHLARRADVARLLIAAGADASARTVDTGIGLHWPAKMDSGRPFDPQLLSVLVEAGADANAVTKDGRSPLDFTIALAEGNSLEERVLALLSVGADPGAGKGRGKSVAHYIVEMLLSRFQFSQRVRNQSHMLEKVTGPLVAMIAAAVAWDRRRHALLAIRGRYSAAPAPATASAAVGGCGTGDEAEAAAAADTATRAAHEATGALGPSV